MVNAQGVPDVVRIFLEAYRPRDTSSLIEQRLSIFPPCQIPRRFGMEPPGISQNVAQDVRSRLFRVRKSPIYVGGSR
jgi:hypothetical protein